MDVVKIVPKKTFFLVSINIFFSVKGIRRIPKIISNGSFTDNHIGI